MVVRANSDSEGVQSVLWLQGIRPKFCMYHSSNGKSTGASDGASIGEKLGTLGGTRRCVSGQFSVVCTSNDVERYHSVSTWQRSTLAAVDIGTNCGNEIFFEERIFQGEKIIAVSGSFHVGEHIHLLEARALLYAISHLPHSYVDQPIAIYVDNSSVNGALQRTWSRAFTLNIIIGKIHEELRSKGYVLDGIVQVLSKDNIADVLSRIGRNSYMEM